MSCPVHVKTNSGTYCVIRHSPKIKTKDMITCCMVRVMQSAIPNAVVLVVAIECNIVAKVKWVENKNNSK
jgi:hypothetical protein